MRADFGQTHSTIRGRPKKILQEKRCPEAVTCTYSEGIFNEGREGRAIQAPNSEQRNAAYAGQVTEASRVSGKGYAKHLWRDAGNRT
jgi:hypothetical protein